MTPFSYRAGPGMMVSAAFIGPGTVTACTVAGADFGFALLWALLFATITTMLLQGLSVRVALGTGKGLAEAMVELQSARWARWLIAALILAALAIGNAAYEAGNIAGSVLGLAFFAPDFAGSMGPIAVVMLAAIALFFGRALWVERLLVVLVVLMSLAFLVSLTLIKPDWSALFSGFLPSLPEGGLLTAIALIGTTVVPYNLFLHAARVREKWGDESGMDEALTDSRISIGIGGLVSIAIMATAAAALFGQNREVANALDMAKAIDPVAGDLAGALVAVGLLAAGLSSAITAPMATGYIAREIFAPVSRIPADRIYRIAIALVLLAGLAGAMSGYSPVEIILLAQVANGLLLPLVAWFLLRLAIAQADIGTLTTIAGYGVFLVALLLGGRLVARAMGIWP